ncbi:MAG: hypothetical protein AAGM33_06430 [Pseudomonadota bacterium]
MQTLLNIPELPGKLRFRNPKAEQILILCALYNCFAARGKQKRKKSLLSNGL